MPVTLLDLIVLGVMLISGLLAMVRGFLREVLAIGSWAAAAFMTVWAYPKVLPMPKSISAMTCSLWARRLAGFFVLTLIVVSLITVKISDAVLDSRVGALDRSLGFLFGLGRAYSLLLSPFYSSHGLCPKMVVRFGVNEAKSKVVLQGTGNWLMSLLRMILRTPFLSA